MYTKFVPCWKYLWLTMVLICFRNNEKNFNILRHNLMQAFAIRPFFFSVAAASAAISSAQHEKSSISTIYKSPDSEITYRYIQKYL